MIVEVGKLLKVDLALTVAGVAESVQVTAESPTIDVKQATAATNLRAERSIACRRAATSVARDARAGRQPGSRSGGISIDGASAAENKFYLDGIDTTNLRTGVSATPFLTDFIEEVQVKSSGYAAEFGGATGGVVSVISKSGTNQFRGEGGFYFNNDALNGDLALNNVFGTAGAARRQRSRDSGSGNDRHAPRAAAAAERCERGRDGRVPEGRLLTLGSALPGGRPDRARQDVVLGRLHAADRGHRPHGHVPHQRADRHVPQQGDDAEPGRQRDLADVAKRCDSACPVRTVHSNRTAACRTRTARATRRRSSPSSASSRTTSRRQATSTGWPRPGVPQRQGQLLEVRHQRPRHSRRDLVRVRARFERDIRNAARTRQGGRIQQPADQPRALDRTCTRASAHRRTQRST